jgi:hypothetical protein
MLISATKMHKFHKEEEEGREGGGNSETKTKKTMIKNDQEEKKTNDKEREMKLILYMTPTYLFFQRTNAL